MSRSRYEQLLQAIVNQSKQEEGKAEFAEGVFTQHNMKETSAVSRALVITRNTDRDSHALLLQLFSLT